MRFAGGQARKGSLHAGEVALHKACIIFLGNCTQQPLAKGVRRPQLDIGHLLGRYSDEKHVIDTDVVVEAPILPRVDTEVTARYDEFTLGMDLQVDYKGLGIKGEWTWGTRKFVDPYRPTEFHLDAYALALGQDPRPMADFTLFGAWGLLYYQLPWIDNLLDTLATPQSTASGTAQESKTCCCCRRLHLNTTTRTFTVNLMYSARPPFHSRRPIVRRR